MKIAIEIPGSVYDGVESFGRGETRLCLNLAEALALAGYEVDGFSYSPEWGTSYKVKGLSLIDFHNADIGKKYDAFIDACWWNGKRHEFLPQAKVYMHVSFGFGEEKFDAQLINKNHCIVYPYKKEVINVPDYLTGRAFLLPFPFFIKRMVKSDSKRTRIGWASKVFGHDKKAYDESLMAHSILKVLAERFDLGIEYFLNPTEINGEKWYLPGQEILDGLNIRFHKLPPFREFKNILSNCKIVMNHTGAFSGACIDSLIMGALPTAMKGGLYEEPAKQMGILIDETKDLIKFEKVLSDDGMYIKAVDSFQSVISYLSYENSVRCFNEIMEMFVGS